MELGEKRMDILSFLSMIELEAASGDELEAYLFQEGEGSTIFQAGGKEHRLWKSKLESREAVASTSASVPSPGSSSCSSSADIPREFPTSCTYPDHRDCYYACGVTPGLSVGFAPCYLSSSSNSDEFCTFSRDKSPSPEEGTDTNGYQDSYKVVSFEIEEEEEEVKPAVVLEKSPSYFHKEIGSIMSAQIKAFESHGQRSTRKKRFLGVKPAPSLGDGDGFGSMSEAHPIQAIEISLRRWIDFLENHDVSASYRDLVQLQFFAQRFINLVEFFLFTLVDILLRSSRVFDALVVDMNEGVLFPPLSSFIREDFEAAGEEESGYKKILKQTAQECSAASADHKSRQRKSELQRLQEWLMDGIDYLGNQEIVVHYEDYQLLHTTAKQLLELVESYFKYLVDGMLNRFAPSIGLTEPVCLRFEGTEDRTGKDRISTGSSLRNVVQQLYGEFL